MEMERERERRMMRKWRDVALMMRIRVLNLQQLMRAEGAKRLMRVGPDVSL
jgi:hypothetical protein